MTKRISTIISSLVLLAISFILLLIFFIFNSQNSNSQNKPLSIYASDVVLTVGESVSNFYILSDEKAIVEITSTNNSIFEVKDKKLTALKTGKAQLTLIATLDKQIAKTSFNLEVIKSDYTFAIETANNCTIEDNNIYMQSTSCQFSIKVYDKNENTYVSKVIEYSATNDAIIVYEMSSFILFTSQNCTVCIKYPEINLEIKINVYVN